MYLPEFGEVHNLKKKMNKEILIKYLNNNCNDSEFEELVRWVGTEASSMDGKAWVSDDWKTFAPDQETKEGKKYIELLNKIHHEINLRNCKSKNERNVLNLKTVSGWLTKAAAVLFLPLLGVLFYLISDYNYGSQKYSESGADTVEVIAPIGSRTVVQLSDGTEVNLNYGSAIKYPRNFTGNTREIHISGEGYFDVAHDQNKPFIVKTAKLDIKVLGTKFSVQAYPGDDEIATTLVEGKVVIEKQLPGKKVEQLGVLVPGQHVSYNMNSGKIFSTKGSIYKYIAWKEGRLVFDNEPITGVAEKLSRMFNVDIEVDENAREFTYTVTFMNDPLYLILDLMIQTTPVKYTILPRKKQSDGTYSKQKIRIEKRS